MILSKGILSVDKLQHDPDALNLSILKLPTKGLTFEDAQLKCFRTLIRSDDGELNLGLIYFPSSCLPTEFIGVPLSVTGLMQFGFNNNDWPPYKFILTVMTYQRMELETCDLFNVGVLEVIAYGFYRRVLDVDNLFDPIFEFYLQNKCIYTNSIDVLNMAFHRGPILQVLNTVDKADDYLIPCMIFGSFRDISNYHTIQIQPSNAVMQFIDLMELDISEDSTISPQKMSIAFSAVPFTAS